MTDWYSSIFPHRLAFGITFFVILGFMDAIRNPADPKRAKEYLFLLFGAVIGTVFGVLHDVVTLSISPEYFTMFKGIASEPGELTWAVVWMAIQATYWVGAVGATILLVANNPSERYPQLWYRDLALIAMRPVLGAVSGGVLAAIGYQAIRPNLHHLMNTPALAGVPSAQFVWAIHCGSYAGSAIGMIWAAVEVRRERARPHPN